MDDDDIQCVRRATAESLRQSLVHARACVSTQNAILGHLSEHSARMVGISSSLDIIDCDARQARKSVDVMRRNWLARCVCGWCPADLTGRSPVPPVVRRPNARSAGVQLPVAHADDDVYDQMGRTLEVLRAGALKMHEEMAQQSEHIDAISKKMALAQADVTSAQRRAAGML